MREVIKHVVINWYIKQFAAFIAASATARFLINHVTKKKSAEIVIATRGQQAAAWNVPQWTRYQISLGQDGLFKVTHSWGQYDGDGTLL